MAILNGLRSIQRPLAALLAMLAIPVLLIGPASASKAKGSPAAPSLKEGLTFYRGKTITFISPDAPGGGFDVWSRLVAPYLAKYLHASGEVTNIAAGDTVGGQDALAHSLANGLTIGWLSPGIDIEIALTKTAGLNFNPVREAFIGMTQPSVTVLVAGESPGCPTSISSLIADSKSGHPSSMLLETVGILDEFSRLTNVALDLKLKLIPGYTSTANQIQGFVRGDGCLMMAPLAAVGPLITQHKAIPLITFGRTVPGIAYASNLSTTPDITSALRNYGGSLNSSAERAAKEALVALTPDSGDALAVPSATMNDKVVALRAALAWVMQNRSFRTAALSQGEIPGLVPGRTAKLMYVDGLKRGRKVAQDLG